MINWTKAQDTCPNGHQHSLFTALRSDILNIYLCPQCDSEIFKDRSEYEKQLIAERDKIDNSL